jgi:S1-C subfamily serine protease
LLLVTNLHCLGLEGIYHADDDGSPELINYSLEVHFPNGVSKKVTELGLLKGTADLAWLIVDAKGVEFESLGMPLDIPTLEAGADVVVVGSPADPTLQGSHTFGKVSAIRSMQEEDGKRITYIQTDAAINQGNSGGPMFAKVGERYIWVGIATAKIEGADNLGLAIEAHELRKREVLGRINATPQGVLSFFNQGTVK